MIERMNPELTRQLRALFARLAAPGKGLEGAGKKDGVAVRYSNTRPRVTLFEFVTHDDLHLQIEVKQDEVTRQYLDDLVGQLMREIEQKREARSPLILNTSDIHAQTIVQSKGIH